jgi:hypothetical protein
VGARGGRLLAVCLWAQLGVGMDSAIGAQYPTGTGLEPQPIWILSLLAFLWVLRSRRRAASATVWATTRRYLAVPLGLLSFSLLLEAVSFARWPDLVVQVMVAGVLAAAAALRIVPLHPFEEGSST